MALRDDMAASAAPCLQPGEPVQAIFGAETLRVHRRFFRDIETADASARATAA